jgi:hypothetical protein
LALLEANRSLARASNQSGRLPLHVACSYRASHEVVAALVEAYPEGAGMPTISGAYPLHLLCEHGCSVEVIQRILETEAGATRGILDKYPRYNCRPLELLIRFMNVQQCQRILSTSRQARQRQREIRHERVDGQQEEFERLNASVAEFRRLEFWKKAAMLLLVEHTKEAVSCSLCIDELICGSALLRACVANPMCPPFLQEFALLLYDDQLAIPDDEGNLPLHIAASTGSWSVVRDLVNAYPGAAAVQNNNGDLPLAIILRRTDVRWSGGLRLLLETNPTALGSEDIHRQLYPRVLARLASSVDVLYGAARGQPELFQSRSDRNATMILI